MRETVRDLDIIATATDAQALVDYFCSLPWVVDVAAKGSTKATVVSHDGLRFDLRVVPPESYGNLLQHFTGSKHHNVALREDAVRRGFSVSEYSVTEVETGEEHALRDRGGGLPLPRLRLDPARAARERRRARRRAQGRAARARRARATCAATCTRTRRGRTARTRSRRWSRRRSRAATRTTRSATTRSGCAASCCAQQAEQIDALNELVAPFRILKGIEVNIRARRRRSTSSDEDLATRDWVVASVHSRFDHDPTERVLRGDGEPVRRLHRPPDEPQDRQAPAGARSTSSA